MGISLVLLLFFNSKSYSFEIDWVSLHLLINNAMEEFRTESIGGFYGSVYAPEKRRRFPKKYWHFLKIYVDQGTSFFLLSTNIFIRADSYHMCHLISRNVCGINEFSKSVQRKWYKNDLDFWLNILILIQYSTFSQNNWTSNRKELNIQYRTKYRFYDWCNLSEKITAIVT